LAGLLRADFDPRRRELMPLYTVRWDIEIDEDSPREAALEAARFWPSEAPDGKWLSKDGSLSYAASFYVIECEQDPDNRKGYWRENGWVPVDLNNIDEEENES
jgi:hypothetical protein